ncbi:MAG: glycoside hydrolase family 2 TIM barrel-domain containing protein [Clostridiales bacterium]|nr:glycoside hydrolase family 2 TIM barrel-domain containing protein [Clostridiales bacterium]
MHAISFNTGWTCRHIDGSNAPQPVTIPHDAMLEEHRDALAPSGKNGCWFAGFDYLYEKAFIAPADWADKALLLEFEGVYQHAEVMLDGEKLAFRPYGYTNFYVDLTGKLTPGEHTLSVIARNSDQPNSRWYSGAGIYRPVTLWLGGEKHILVNGVKIRTTSIVPATISVTVDTSLEGFVNVEVLDGSTVLASATAASRQQGAEAARAEFEFVLPQAELWGVDHPKLYTCRVSFGSDQVEESFGVRSLTWGKDGICINGERVIIQGACIHHDHGFLGAKCFPEAEERRVRLLKENGYNALRSAHNPCSKALLDACDRLGMLVMDEYIDHWYIHKTEHDYVQYFADWWQQDLTDMVEKDYNHPSVILYSTGNEVSETAQPKGIALTRQMTDFLHHLDSTRPVTCGVNIFFNFLSSIGFGVYSDKKAKKEAEAAEKAKAKKQTAKKKAVGSQFFNDMAGLLGDEFMKRGATLHGCDVKTRGAFAAMDIAGYNYGIYRYQHDLKKYPERLILGSETFCNDAYRFRELAKKEPRLVGDFVWAGMDYMGEVGVGSWEYREYAPQFEGLGWMLAGSGRIDLTGKPLGEALYTRVALEKEIGPYIAVRPVNHEGEKHSPSAWKMTNAMDSWSWRGCEGRMAFVEVYARAAKVELLLNGKSAGTKALKNTCLAHFHIPYENGELTAVSYDRAGREIGRKTLVTAGEPTQLRIEPEAAPEQGKLCWVRLRYTDENGILKPMERGHIQVTVTGGQLLGLGSACPFYPESYLDATSDTYYGEALAIVLPEQDMTITADDGKHHAETRLPIA